MWANRKVSDRAIALARMHLPISKGGLGLVRQAQVAHVAYVGGIAATLARAVGPAEQGGLGMEAPDQGAPTPAFLAPNESACKTLSGTYGDSCGGAEYNYRNIWLKPMPQAQSTLYALTIAHNVQQIEANLSKLDYKSVDGRYRRDAHKASTAPEAGAWLTANPQRLGCKMTDVTFEHALYERLCLPRLGINPDDKCHLCNKPVDTYANHAMLCPGMQRFRTARARLHQELLRQVANKAGLSVYPGEPAVAMFMDAKPGGRQDPETAARFDLAITSKGQNGEIRVDAVDLKFTATTKASDKKTYAAAGDAANRAELGKCQYYNRSYIASPGGPKVVVRGFGQETGGPLGDYAKSLLRTCAMTTPSYGLPGQDSASNRLRSFFERFSVLNQANLRDRGLAPPPNPDAPSAAPVPEEEEEEEEE